MSDGPGANRSGEDIEKIKGRNRILLIAPHGHKQDDENTGILTREIAVKLGCYAIISEIYRKPGWKRDPKTGDMREVADPDVKKDGHPVVTSDQDFFVHFIYKLPPICYKSRFFKIL